MSVTEPESAQPSHQRNWPDYRAVWRWHFYAGLFCIPFVIVLSVSGLIYLFKPQIESWTERHYDDLQITGQKAPPSRQIAAALESMPGSSFSSYELPPSDSSAARIVVRDGKESIRTYVHPVTLQILGSVPEDGRLMRWIFRLHGELLMGNRGSNLVEMAACWTIVLLITGLFLWWPRNAKGLGGVLYPRLFGGSRMFWRDIHSVVGMWISFCAIFLILTGLPWAKFWGDYFKQIRQVTGTAVARQDWANSSGGSENGDQPDSRTRKRRGNSGRKNETDHSEHGIAGTQMGSPESSDAPVDLSMIDTMVANVIPLKLDDPVIISAPGGRSSKWNAKSNTPNRPRRVTVELDPRTGAVLNREDFSSRHWIDRAVGYGIAAHEGALFGWPNQVLGVLTTMGLVLLSVSGVILWWRRRDQGVLGAPRPALSPRLSWGLISIILFIGICLPLFAASLVLVLLLEWLVLSRIAPVRNWLGLITYQQQVKS